MSSFSPFWIAVIALTVLGFWVIPARFRMSALAVGTLAAVAFMDQLSAVILAALVASTWFYTRKGEAISGDMAAFAIGLPVAMLFGFKLLSASRGDDVIVSTIVPLGLSFYALRATHFAFERFLGRIGPVPFLSVAQYLLFMPTILIGPIHRFPAFQRDIRRHRWDPEMFSAGLERLLYGAFKIAVLGNFLTARVFGTFVNETFESDTSTGLYLGMIVIGLNLYFQFSGASDMAIGFARCLGFRIMENFNWPLLATSIPDFWRRWHISLTGLVREYVYSGISAVSRNAKLAALVTMIVIGLWHEISLRYLLWGVYHGLGVAVWQGMERRLPARILENRSYKVAGWLITQHFVFFGFYFVRLPDPVGSLIGLVRN